MSQWDKLIAEILSEDPGLRFEDLRRALLKMGYTEHQPRSGSSHFTYRKPTCLPITIPKHTPLKRVYIGLVAEAVRLYLEEDRHE